MRAAPSPGSRPIPLEIQAELVHVMLDRQYRSLLDEPVPTLGNLSATTHGGCVKKLWWFIRNQISSTIATSRTFTRGSRAGAGRGTRSARYRSRCARWRNACTGPATVTHQLDCGRHLTALLERGAIAAASAAEQWRYRRNVIA